MENNYFALLANDVKKLWNGLDGNQKLGIHSTDGGEPGGKRRGESLGGSVCHHGIGKREADPVVV